MARKSTAQAHDGLAHDRVSDAHQFQGNTPYNPICLDESSSDESDSEEEDDNPKTALSDSLVNVNSSENADSISSTNSTSSKDRNNVYDSESGRKRGDEEDEGGDEGDHSDDEVDNSEGEEDDNDDEDDDSDDDSSGSSSSDSSSYGSGDEADGHGGDGVHGVVNAFDNSGCGGEDESSDEEEDAWGDPQPTYTTTLDKYWLEYEYAEGRYAVVERVLNADEQEFAVKKVKEEGREMTLQDLVQARGTLTEVETRIIGKQIASGVGHIHGCGFLHRDLKPENIIFAAGMVPKVIDLGFALSTARENVSAVWGSDGFIALEVIGMEAHSRAMDIWSIGAFFFIMLFDATQKLTKELGRED
ncbi:MAG: kinase-like domain-containing protein [Linnemannia gamsii]|nr:MAG: kinase-like domain-containing protein [Linnemannia gamsii]